MDACDPDVKTKNIRKLIKLHTGRNLNIPRDRMCEISKDIASGNLPLPPLVMTRDKTYLLDPKSPLTKRDYESLYKSNVKSRTVKRIAKKVGLSDIKKTIVELKYAIGRRLISLNIREPILLPGSRVVSKMRFNNSPRNYNDNYENVNNNRENREDRENADTNNRENRENRENANTNRENRENRENRKNGNNNRQFSPMTNDKLRNMITRRRQKERTRRMMGKGFINRSSNYNRSSERGNTGTSNNRSIINNIQRNANKRVKNTRLAAERYLSESRIINGRRKKRQFNVVENKLRLEQRNKFRAENNTRRAQASENRARREKRRVQLNANINAQRANNLQNNYEHLRRSAKIKMNRMKFLSNETLEKSKKISETAEKYKKELSNRKANVNSLQKNLTERESEIERVTKIMKNLQEKVNKSSNNGEAVVNNSKLEQAQKQLANIQTNRDKLKSNLQTAQTELEEAKERSSKIEKEKAANIELSKLKLNLTRLSKQKGVNFQKNIDNLNKKTLNNGTFLLPNVENLRKRIINAGNRRMASNENKNKQRQNRKLNEARKRQQAANAKKLQALKIELSGIANRGGVKANFASNINSVTLKNGDGLKTRIQTAINAKQQKEKEEAEEQQKKQQAAANAKAAANAAKASKLQNLKEKLTKKAEKGGVLKNFTININRVTLNNAENLKGRIESAVSSKKRARELWNKAGKAAMLNARALLLVKSDLRKKAVKGGVFENFEQRIKNVTLEKGPGLHVNLNRAIEKKRSNKAAAKAAVKTKANAPILSKNLQNLRQKLISRAVAGRVYKNVSPWDSRRGEKGRTFQERIEEIFETPSLGPNSELNRQFWVQRMERIPGRAAHLEAIINQAARVKARAPPGKTSQPNATGKFVGVTKVPNRNVQKGFSSNRQYTSNLPNATRGATPNRGTGGERWKEPWELKPDPRYPASSQQTNPVAVVRNNRPPSRGTGGPKGGMETQTEALRKKSRKPRSRPVTSSGTNRRTAPAKMAHAPNPQARKLAGIGRNR